MKSVFLQYIIEELEAVSFILHYELMVMSTVVYSCCIDQLVSYRTCQSSWKAEWELLGLVAIEDPPLPKLVMLIMPNLLKIEVIGWGEDVLKFTKQEVALI